MVGSDRNTVQGFIDDMVLGPSNTDDPTVVKDNKKTKVKPVVVHKTTIVM